MNRENLLEEAVDCILVAYSIAYDAGFSDQEIDSLMAKKIEKWRKKIEKWRFTCGYSELESTD